MSVGAKAAAAHGPGDECTSGYRWTEDDGDESIAAYESLLINSYQTGRVPDSLQTDWLTNWLAVELSAWLVVKLTDWQTDYKSLANWLTDKPTDKLTGNWLTDLLANWPAGWQAGWQTGWSAGKPTGWLTSWVQTDWLAGKLAGWQTAWLAKWLSNWLVGLPAVYRKRLPSGWNRVVITFSDALLTNQNVRLTTGWQTGSLGNWLTVKLTG